ncbi:MAG TPA: hypothetical protein VGQ83_02595 [Polyangia bacterium]|jgi:hypothetical protein
MRRNLTPGAVLPRVAGRTIPAALVVLLLGCGDRALTGFAAPADGGGAVPGDATAAGDCALRRVPLHHRPASPVCPRARAATTPTQVSACPDGGVSPMLICDCTMDSDCTSGPNGRCGQWIPPPVLACTYDECFQDSDCAGGAPCACRPSSASSAPNACVGGGNCTVDSDCGPGGYCSPSVLDRLCACFSPDLCPDGGGACYEGSPGATGTPPGPGWTQVPCACGDKCGHGFYCHTCSDTCIDDSDCAGAGTCNYDVLGHRWECSAAMCAP